MTRDSDRNALHPAVRDRKTRTFIGVVMLAAAVGVGGVTVWQEALNLWSFSLTALFLVWGGVLVDKNTFVSVLKELLAALPNLRR